MNHAITLAVLSMLGWGVWTVLANEATRTIDPPIAMILSYATGVVVALGYVGFQNDPISLDRSGVILALAAGVFAGLGAVAFYAGLSYGRVGVVTTVSALYFVVATVLGVFVLGESIAITDVLGIGFAVLAVVLLAN
ncbi:EamA family transporter [Halosolutus halophilus]|uniref:EamA family transporter n=1 Tax=Halosolutus halophilus TaxID=1552990 RepID=UPI00223517D3|nr:DMT family transporter [Halosolutus halophilus]